MKTIGFLLLFAVSGAAYAQFEDPLDVAALTLAAPAKAPITALTHAGPLLVGVGMRGLIVSSADGGVTWTQQPSPVQSDLTAVTFVGPATGWIVGHDGVILATKDGGKTWKKQLDGRGAATEFAAHYQRLVDAGSEEGSALLMQTHLNYKDGPSLPYLDVCFTDEETGYAVGPFGMIAVTRDGGSSWLPWLEHVDNPDFVTLNAIRKVGDTIFIVGEQGLVFRLDSESQRFLRVSTGYAGTFFGLTGEGQTVIAFGLQGTVYRSADGGRQWQSIAMPSRPAVTAGAAIGKHSFVVANANGELYRSSDDGLSFSASGVGAGAPATAVEPQDGKLVYASSDGLSLVKSGATPGSNTAASRAGEPAAKRILAAASRPQ
ncbi:MAG: photosynthesis system assembly factor family protein [Hydrocarboniphaga sp.]|uniref:WD40/YVTN/BNR-like repeat-containing protein n=1 Tax=Hydrocarboniphaga sp. TaxID=2033016 RepID=UPI002603AE6E|nr:YCF48-related protein [Hydrocarboniphaga sp.]MDB5971164.1 photosynthesis system assembly factor family protein [Hydrocarboniphaga sp.]